MSYFSELLGTKREQAGLSQQDVATAAGVSLATVASWETGRRRPGAQSRQHVIELADLLGFTPVELNDTLAELGLRGVPVGREVPLLDRRKPIAVLRSECAEYTWPVLAMNEDFEVVAWNAAANDISELDFGTDLAEPGARHLLRIALTDNYKEKLENWPEVVGVMVSMWKATGFDPLAPGTGTPYFDNLVAYIIANHAARLGELLGMWQSAVPFTEGQRVVFDVRWRTSAGVALAFHCNLTSWSDFDAVAAFDWHPANAATWEWLESQSAGRDVGTSEGTDDEPVILPAASSARELLRFARERAGLTQRELGERAGVSQELVYGLESGRRQMVEPTLRRLAHAMTLNAADRNAMLEAAGFAPEPSEQHAYILGYDVSESARYGHSMNRHMTWSPAAVQQEIAPYAWPVLVVNERCEVIATNGPADRMFGSEVSRLEPETARNLFALITDEPFRKRAANWESVVANVMPGNLEAYLSPPGVERGLAKDAAYFDAVVSLVRSRESAAGRGDGVVHETFAAWRARQPRRRTARVTFRLDWESDAGRLAFNTVITPWSAMIDPYWAIELHPADAATWRALS